MKKAKPISAVVLAFCLVVSMLFTKGGRAAAEVSPVQVNFQTAESQTPNGFLPDTGKEYGNRGNGLTYGWSSNHVTDARDHSKFEPDLKLATLNQMGAGDVWEMAVPNGTYEVTVSIGDILHPDQIRGNCC
ncbi:hypothetical protein N6H14_09995 [Paenibacillus sp. CC-CFT747]|nr:hypothetical protein N6H14_09995 [Paenibacillus sp. CC-CFT747]